MDGDPHSRGIGADELEAKGFNARLNSADPEVANLLARSLMRRPFSGLEDGSVNPRGLTRDGVERALRRLITGIEGSTNG